jgi:trans-2-enoyl-CoA reductase
MNRTFYELCEDLKKLDEITLMELLNLTSEEIVNSFQDKIEDNFDRLSNEINNELKDYDTYE